MLKDTIRTNSETNGVKYPTRNDYSVLIELYNGETNELKAYTKKIIMEKTHLSRNKINKTLDYFKRIGYVDEGIMCKNAKTYYITQLGEKKIQEILQ